MQVVDLLTSSHLLGLMQQRLVASQEVSARRQLHVLDLRDKALVAAILGERAARPVDAIV